MSEVAQLPAWAAVVTAGFLVLGGFVALIGSLGLWRLGNFYERVHAPTLGTTLGTGCILAASMLYFLTQQARPVRHEILIVALSLVTTPAALTMLVRAALHRDRAEKTDGVPRLRDSSTSAAETGFD